MLKTTKEKVYKKISESQFLGRYEEYDGILKFLSKIWDLKKLPSEDSRYPNAYQDIMQHFVHNDDWSLDYLFLERLTLIDGDENHFVVFIETVLNPTVRKNEEEILKYVGEINPLISTDEVRLVLSSYFDELPVYKLKKEEDVGDLPADILDNKIPFYFETREVRTFPCFELHSDNWNDYNRYTTFDLFFRPNEFSHPLSIGKIKIMRRDEFVTKNVLPKKWYTLDRNFCSVGQSKVYYFELKKILKNEFHSVLYGLRDASLFPKINEQFEKNSIFRVSLIRSNDVERITRTIRFELEGVPYDEYFKFNYKYEPPFAKNQVALDFNFHYQKEFEHRIYAIIGKNGTGKTNLLSSLAKGLSKKETEAFIPRKPIYGKIFTVSYSFFDNFEIPKSNASFNYVYCGLKKSSTKWKTDNDLILEFQDSVQLITDNELVKEWHDILADFINQDILDVGFERKEYPITAKDYKFRIERFNDIRKMLSSGESIILFLITKIFSQIRFDSLILFDEPENHLHPNAISALINTLFKMVKKFQSFCIISTHSPLVIQEISARNVFVLERENEILSVRGLEKESFGQNLTVITQEIFGNREIPKYYVNIIRDLLNKGKEKDEIISLLETDGLPLPSNIPLYINALSS